jgi:hypothetical protein
MTSRPIEEDTINTTVDYDGCSSYEDVTLSSDDYEEVTVSSENGDADILISNEEHTYSLPPADRTKALVEYSFPSTRSAFELNVPKLQAHVSGLSCFMDLEINMDEAYSQVGNAYSLKSKKCKDVKKELKTFNARAAKKKNEKKKKDRTKNTQKAEKTFSTLDLQKIQKGKPSPSNDKHPGGNLAAGRTNMGRSSKMKRKSGGSRKKSKDRRPSSDIDDGANKPTSSSQSSSSSSSSSASSARFKNIKRKDRKYKDLFLKEGLPSRKGSHFESPKTSNGERGSKKESKGATRHRKSTDRKIKVRKFRLMDFNNQISKCDPPSGQQTKKEST